MRIAGLCSDSAESTQAFIEAASDDERRLVFPAKQGLVVAAVNEEAIPTISWTSRADGAFVIIDGELFDDRYGYGTDQAVTILNEYCSGGISAVANVKGAANIAVWDPNAGQFLFVRSRYGEMPCFFAANAKGMFWSSRLDTLLAAGVVGEINQHAIDCFVARGFVPAPWSYIRGIQKVPPGHFLTWEVGRPAKVTRYWRPSVKSGRMSSAGQIDAEFVALFEQSLRRRYTVGEPLGVLLSGGVDSKLIVAGLNRLLGVAGENINTFTFLYADHSGRWNETNEALRFARHFGTQHEEIVFRPSDVANNLERMVRAFDGPFSYGLHTIMLKDIVDAGVSAVMVGAGPDGWYLDRFEHYGLYLARLPAFVRAGGRAVSSSTDVLSSMFAAVRLPLLARLSKGVARRAEAIHWVAETGLPSHCDRTITPDEIRQDIFKDRQLLTRAAATTFELFTNAQTDFRDHSRPDQISLLHQQTFGAECILHWLQACAQAHDLSMRCPYFDEELFEFAMELERKSLDKEDVRRVAASLMPRDMAYTPKIAQTVPIREWFRGPLKEFVTDQLSDHRIRRQGLFEPKAILRLINEHMSEKANHEWRLWTIMTVTVWSDIVSGKSGT